MLHLALPVLGGRLAVQMRYGGQRAAVGVVAELADAQVEFRVERHGGLVAGDQQPGEGLGGERLRVVEPGVAAEDLVGGLAGQGDGGVLADLAEQQVERGVHVADADRRVPRHDHRLAVLGVEQGTRVEDDRAVVGADEGAGLDGVRGVVAGAQDVAGELLGLVAVVDGIGADTGVGAFAQPEFVGEQGGQDGGVDAAGQQAAQRDVGLQLTAGGRADQARGSAPRSFPGRRCGRTASSCQ